MKSFIFGVKNKMEIDIKNSGILKSVIYALFEKEYENYSFLRRYTKYQLFDANNMPTIIGVGDGTCYVQQECTSLSDDYVSICQDQYVHPADIIFPFPYNKLDFFAQEKNPEHFVSVVGKYVKDFIDKENKFFINFIKALPSTQVEISELISHVTVKCSPDEKEHNYFIFRPKKGTKVETLEIIKNNIFCNPIETDNLLEEECLLVKNVAISSFSSELDFIPVYYMGKYSPYLYRRVGLAAHFVEESEIFRYSSGYVRPVSLVERIFEATEKEKIYYLDF